VIALGADGSVTPADVTQALRLLGPRRELVLVTPRELGGGSGSDAETVRTSGREKPNQIRVLDWVRESQGHSAWFQPDGVHLTFPGADAFTRFLRRAFAYAAPAPASLVCPRGSGGPGANPTPSGQLIRAQVPNGRLHVDQARNTTKLTVLNENTVAVSGLVRLDPTPSRGAGAPSDQRFAEACITLAAGAGLSLTLHLTPYGAEQVALHRHVAVRLTLTIAAPGTPMVKTSGVYLLERPRRG
jgi:hypothetical protein